MTKPTADPEPKKKSAENDPVLSSFLSFLASDMQRFPARIRPLDRNILDRIGTIVKEVKTSSEEDLETRRCSEWK